MNNSNKKVIILGTIAIIIVAAIGIYSYTKINQIAKIPAKPIEQTVKLDNTTVINNRINNMVVQDSNIDNTFKDIDADINKL